MALQSQPFRLGVNPGGDDTRRVTIVPFTKSPMTLIQTFDTRTPSPKKNDLNASDPPVPALKPLEALAVMAFDGLPTYLLETMMAAELNALAGVVGHDMFLHFKNNPTAGAPKVFPPGSPLSTLVEVTDAFKKAHDAVRLEFEAAIKKQTTAGRLDVNALEANTETKGRFGRRQMTNPDGIKTSVDLQLTGSGVTLAAVIGSSFQGGQVALKDIELNLFLETYTATLVYTLIDHFGVDNGDVLPPPPHGSPGQIAFWVLQHSRHPGHNPYVTTVVIERMVSGSLAPDFL